MFLLHELEFYEDKNVVLFEFGNILFLNVGVEDEEKFFSTQERQLIVVHLLYVIRILKNEIKIQS